MTIRVILELQANAASGEKLKQLFRELLPDTRKFDGCRNVVVLENKDNAGNVVLVEEWDSRPKYEKYLAWRQEMGLSEKLGPLLAGPPSIRFFDLVDA